VLATVEVVDRVLEGGAGELLAGGPVVMGQAMVVVYREVSEDDGFVITAFVTSRLARLEQRVQLWPPQR